MRDNEYVITENKCIAENIFLMKLKGDTSEIDNPGLFINLKVTGCYLRRPMSIAGYTHEEITIVYKVVGKGTEILSGMKPGEKIDALCPLGNGYDLEEIPDDALLIGGGAGAVPIYFLAKELIRKGKSPTVIAGFNSEKDIIFKEEFRALDTEVKFVTVDGSVGIKGFVTEGMNGGEYVCACGPEPMLKAVAERAERGQYDLSARMACGFGACMGCTIITKNGPKRVCKEGPVFFSEEIIW